MFLVFLLIDVVVYGYVDYGILLLKLVFLYKVDFMDNIVMNMCIEYILYVEG